MLEAIQSFSHNRQPWERPLQCRVQGMLEIPLLGCKRVVHLN